MYRSLVLYGSILSSIAALTSAGAQEPTEEDCVLAESHYSLAQDRLAEFREAEATVYLERAGAACPRYVYFQEMGELRMKSLEEADLELAVDAFLESHVLANSDVERARALWKYAELLNQEGDPQNAYPLILEASRLNADDQDISDLASAIRTQIETPTREQLVRGLSLSMYKPLHVSTSSGQFATDTTATVGVAPSPQIANGPSINIRINFEFNSTTVAPDTRDNIELITRTLAGEELTGRNFEFVGHADVRGEATHNMQLSRRRAMAIYETVIQLDTSLEDRISVTGRGESEPIDRRDIEDAHRASRRLQILVK
jgi:outer membrane protein OmpA-like peptidoglycan-associated protein